VLRLFFDERRVFKYRTSLSLSARYVAVPRVIPQETMSRLSVTLLSDIAKTSDEFSLQHKHCAAWALYITGR
jgi:hypothetical protein